MTKDHFIVFSTDRGKSIGYSHDVYPTTGLTSPRSYIYVNYTHVIRHPGIRVPDNIQLKLNSKGKFR